MSASDVSTTEPNKRLVARWIELANARELDALREIWAEDLVLHAGVDVPDVVGFDAFRALLESFYEGFPDMHIALEDVIAERDEVVTRTLSRGTHTGTFMGIAPTGRTGEFMGINTFRVGGGVIVEEWFNDDLFTLMTQLGVPAA
jgi:steroid delta-isomerase-like uncharacterized protein